MRGIFTPSSRRSRHVLAAQVHAEAERKKEEIRERAERELAAELERQAATEEERERLRADLVRQETERKNASQRKRALAAKLKGMENKLLKGGQLLDKAATQEAELRKAKQELTRKQEAERRMANEMRAPVSFASLHAIEQMRHVIPTQARAGVQEGRGRREVWEYRRGSGKENQETGKVNKKSFRGGARGVRFE